MEEGPNAKGQTDCPSLDLVLKKGITPFPRLLVRSEGRGHRVLIAGLFLGLQHLGTLEKNGIWLVGEHEWEEEVTQFSVSMSQTLDLNFSPQGQDSISSF